MAFLPALAQGVLLPQIANVSKEGIYDFVVFFSPIFVYVPIFNIFKFNILFS